MLVGCPNAVLLKEATVPSPEASPTYGMAATGPKALKQDVDDVDIYTDLSHNDDVSLEFTRILLLHLTSTCTLLSRSMALIEFGEILISEITFNVRQCFVF